MKIKATELYYQIDQGIRDVYAKYCLMSGETCRPPEPEYLTSAGLCFWLAQYLGNIAPELCVIRAEEKTRVLWRRAMLGPVMQDRTLLTKRAVREALKNNSTRNGNVDVSIAATSSGFERPFAVIENKGVLTFAGNGKLYQASLSELFKDIQRNAEFVKGMMNGGIEFSAFTFYLHDTASVTKWEGSQYINDKQAYFDALVSELAIDSSISRYVKIATLDESLFCSAVEANVRDQHGATAYEMEGTSHVAMGLICIWRADKHIQGTRSNAS